MDLPAILSSFKNEDLQTDQILCAHQIGQMPPCTSEDIKFQVTPDQWPPNVLYPEFCLGWLYGMKPSVARKLLEASTTSPYIYISDLHDTGILRVHSSIGIKHIGWSDNFKWFSCPITSLQRFLLVPNNLAQTMEQGTVMEFRIRDIFNYILGDIEAIFYR